MILLSTMVIAAGLLMCRKNNNDLDVFLVHFGGPFWAKKDNGAWHIPKGLVSLSAGESLIDCAVREFREETGAVIPTLRRNLVDLGSTKYNNKEVYIWGVEYDLPKNFVFKSNKTPNGWDENDRGQFFPIEEALFKVLPAQKVFIERLATLILGSGH